MENKKKEIITDFEYNPFRYKKIKDRFLIVNESGSWIVLGKKKFDKLMRKELDPKLFEDLTKKGIIITKNNINQILIDYAKRFEFLFKGASLHIIVTTLRCNHKCIYCHSAAKDCDKKEFDMDLKTAKKTLEFIFQTPSNTITIEFQGGEPLLNWGTFQFIVTEAKKMNLKFNKKIRFALVTNLTCLTEDQLDWIQEQNIDMCTSLDGPQEIHDHNRIYEDKSGTYTAVTNKIKDVRSKGKRIAALMVTTRNSLSKHKEIIDEYVDKGFKDIQIKYLNKLGFAQEKWNNDGYSIEEFIDFWEKSVEYIISLNKRGIFVRERYVVLILKKILTKTDPSFLDFRSPCGLAIGQIAYDHKGNIFSCDEGRNFDLFKLGNVFDNNYKEIINQKKTQQLISLSINSSFLCDNCVYKPYCGLCPVMNYAEEGNMIPKLSSNSKCKLFMFQFDYVFNKLLFEPESRKILLNWLKYK
ncbi:His-Xaa-Ser system radical SAM maturase HxsB [Candidatus Woesearchaeota archaeon]|jgi:uncharacterized protein|nr:His-Xaa-Ser system radical SAM maturase HxsB [Candidatus Woesearchaeota archaeon]